jgi:peptide/nickel transport system permease protein
VTIPTPGGIETVAAVDTTGPVATHEGRSPATVAWRRLKKDRVARISAVTLVVLFVIAIAAPLIEKVYGIGPYDLFPHQTNGIGMPLGYAGGISGQHWFGLEPQIARDIFIRLIYGLRNSLIIAFLSATLSTSIGVVMGMVAGYFGGAVDKVIGWVVDFLLVLPFLLFAIVMVPLLEGVFFTEREAIPNSFEMGLIIFVFVIFGWMGTARLVRGQVVSLREREFVDAARAAGAGPVHIMFRQILPNLWAPILVTFSLALPGYVTGEAALHFLGIGIGGDAPDFGTMIFKSLAFMQTDPAYTFIPGVLILVLVLAFNMFGDSLRDALDPKSSRS